MGAISVSEAIKHATQIVLEKDAAAKQIATIENEIENKRKEITQLEADLYVLRKNRPAVNIKWRDSIMWCLTVDSDDPSYFLKTTAGVYTCVAYKHKVEVDADMKSKVGSTLSLMFRQNLIGRYQHTNGDHYYGLSEYFESDLITLKKKYGKNVDKLL